MRRHRFLILNAEGVVQFQPRVTPTKAINAARHIKVTPATIDGQPVSQYITLEYTFELY